MKFYVATAYGNRAEARAWMDFLESKGHTITHDWTGKAVDPAWPQDVKDEYLDRCGADDLNGVSNADCVLFINHAECRDAMAEFGMALGFGIPVIVVYPKRRSSVFFGYANAVIHEV